MIKAVLFDMNETLLDIKNLKDKFMLYIDDDSISEYWFSKVLHSSSVLSIMGEYVPFSQIAQFALESIFLEKKVTLTENIKQDVLGAFMSMKPYNDVLLAIEVLNQNNIKSFVVSNSSLEMTKSQLENAKIIDRLNGFYSVQSVEKYKPCKEIYNYVLEKEKLNANETFMVASHDWDLFGAKKAGLNTAYIIRKSEVYTPYFPKPDLTGINLETLALGICSY